MRELFLLTFWQNAFQPDCLDDLSYAIMYETTKLAYRVSEADVTRARNQVRWQPFYLAIFFVQKWPVERALVYGKGILCIKCPLKE